MSRSESVLVPGSWFLVPRTKNQEPKTPFVIALILLSLLLFGARLFALPPLFLPEWTRELPAQPDFVRVIRWQPQNPAELVVGLESGEGGAVPKAQLQLLSSDGNRLVASYRCEEPALDVCPVRDSGGSAILAVALPRRILLFDRRLVRLKEILLPLEAGNHLHCLRAGDVSGDRDEELLAFDDRSAWVLTRAGQVMRRLSFAGRDSPDAVRSPRQVMVRDLTRDGLAEIAVFDGQNLVVLDSAGRVLLRYQLQNPPQSAIRSPQFAVPCPCRFDAGDIDADGRVELVALQQTETEAEVLVWRFSPLPSSLNPLLSRSLSPSLLALPGMLRIAGTSVYCAGTSADRTWWLTRLDSAGPTDVIKDAIGEITDINNCDDCLIALVNLPIGLQSVDVIPPDLNASAPQGLGYNGVHVRGLAAGQVGDDDRTDLVVARTSPSGEYALDVFRNNGLARAAALDSACADYKAALRTGRRDAAQRAERRFVLMSMKAGHPTGLLPDVDRLRNQAAHVRRLQGIRILVSALLAIALVAFGLWLVLTLRARRRARTADRLVRPLPELLALCGDTIALDHVFVSKGNTGGALTRIDELRRQHGLTRDPDLSRIRTSLEPYYSHYIYRLINRPKTLDFLSWVMETSRALPLEHGLNVTTLTREQLVRRLREEDFTGNWLVKIQNWDAPDALEHLRLYHDRASERWLEHALADNLRHAQSWSVTALEYTINTTWNRKMTVHFLNDGPGLMDLSLTSTHLGAQFQEVNRRLGGFFEFSRSPAELLEYEKFWVRAWDYLSVLEDTHRRQTRGITGDL
jgi:hypothetical protein